MADTTVDKVKIEIEASAKKAGDSIDKLIEVLKKLQEAAGKIETDKLTSLNNSIANLSANAKDLPKASVFNRLAKGIERLCQIDTSSISAVTNAINGLANSVAALNASGIKDMRIKVRTENATADLSTYDATGSEEAQNALDGTKESLEEVAGAEETAGQSTTTLAERLAALQAKWRDIENSFTANEIISGAIYKMNSAIINGFSRMVSSAKGTLESLKSNVSFAMHRISANMQYAAYSMKDVFPKIGAAIKDAFTHPVSTAIGGIKSLVEMGGRVKNALGNINFSGILAGLVRVGQIAGGIVKSGLQACANGMKAIANGAKTAASKTAAATKGMLKVAVAAKLSNSFFGKMASVVKKSGVALSSLSKRLQSVARLFTFMLLRKAITALFEGLGEAFKHLAQKSEGFNTKISELMSACKNFQHQVAALAGPLLDIFGPALTKIINLLSTATAYINQFLSALSGKSFFTSAKKQNVDYAASLDSVGKAAEEVKDATTGIDELNIISQKDDKNGGGADALEDCYEQLAVNQKILDSVQNLKKLFTELFQPMKQAWEDYGQGVIDGFQYAVSSCKKLVVDMAKTWKEVWLNGSGYETCKNILLLLENMLKWIGDIATAWDLAWQVKGTAYVQSVFDELNAVLSLIYTISESFRNAFNSGSGQEAIEHIYQIITDLNNTIANIANRFREAWKAAGIGDAIAQSIFDIINLILGSVEKISGSTEKWAKSLNLGPLLKSINNLLEKTKPLVEKIGDALSWVWENVILPLGKWAIETALPEVIDGVAVAFEALDAVLEALKPAFKWIWDHMLVPLANWTGGTIVDIIDGITEAFEGISEVFKKISDGEDWGEIGKYIWEGLIDGIENVGEWVWEKLGEIFGGIVDFVKDLLGIHSPSTVFADIGKNTMDGFVGGIESKKEAAKDPINKWAENVINWFTGGDGEGNIFEKFKTFGGDIVSGFREKVGNTYATTKNNITTWAEKVKSWYTNSGFGGINSTTFTNYATSIIDGFKTKVGNYYIVAKDNITTWASKVKSWFTDEGGVSMSGFYNIASDVVTGFKNGIGALYSTCKDTIGTWGASIVSWFKEKLKVQSPSRVFKEIGQFTVAGFNAGIDDSGDSTAAHMRNWLEKFNDFQADITAKVNVKEVMGNYTPKYDTGITSASIERTVRQEINSEGRVRATLENGSGFTSALEDVLDRTISQKLSVIENYTKIQAEKKETTNVYVGDREVAKSVDKQRRDNGFSFTPVTV